MPNAWQTAWVEVVPDLKNFAKKANAGITTALSSAGDQGARVANKSFLGQIFGGNFLANLATRAIDTIGNAIVGAIDYGVEAIDLASALNESFNAVEVTFGADLAKDLRELSTAAPKELRVTQRSFNEFAVRFAAFGRSVVGRSGDVVGFIDDLTTRGADFASVYNIEVADALALFQSGLAGETEPLRKYGIDLSAAAVEAYAYANGIAEAGKELTEAEKVQGRYGLLLEQTAQVAGDAANTSGEYANQQREFSVALEEIQTKLGGLLLPIATEFLGFANAELVPVLEQLVDDFGPELNKFWDENGDDIKAFLSDDLPLVLEGFGKLGKAIAESIPKDAEFFSDLFRIFEGDFSPILESNRDLNQFVGDNALVDLYRNLGFDVSELDKFVAEWGENAESAGSAVAEAYGKGILQSSWPGAAANQIGQDSSESLRRGGGGSFGVGQDVARGFAAGILSKQEEANLAASVFAGRVIESVKSKLRISSPSKVAEELGGFFAEGFGIGVNKSPFLDLAQIPTVSISRPSGAPVTNADQVILANLGPETLRVMRDLVEKSVELNVDGETLARGTVSGAARLAALGAS